MTGVQTCALPIFPVAAVTQTEPELPPVVSEDKKIQKVVTGGLRQRLMAMAEATPPPDKEPAEKSSLTAIISEQKEQGAAAAVKCKLVLRNVPLDFVERDIYEELADFEVTGVHVLRRAEYEGGPRQATGTAFVTLINVNEAEDCLEYMKGICWGHNVVTAEFADK